MDAVRLCVSNIIISNPFLSSDLRVHDITTDFPDVIIIIIRI